MSLEHVKLGSEVVPGDEIGDVYKLVFMEESSAMMDRYQAPCKPQMHSGLCC